MYELVLLHPRHYLRKKGGGLTVFTEHGGDCSGKLYLVSPDGALREGSENNTQRLPAFTSNQARASEDTLKPFLVVLKAEIAFRRFRRRPHPLCAEYTELIDLIIELVNKIYFKPLMDQIEWKLNEIRLAYSTDVGGNVNMEGAVDEFGMGKIVDNELARNQGLGVWSRNRVLAPPMTMSGCGKPLLFSISVDRLLLMLNRLDYDIDEDDEDDNGQPPELGLPTHLGGRGMSFSLLNFVSSLTIPLDIHAENQLFKDDDEP